MDEEIDSLLIDVRAGTQGFARDIAEMRATVDSNLVDGFAQAGNVLERGLLGAIRRGSLGFADLKRVAFSTINEIAAQAVQNLFAGAPGSGRTTGLFDLGGLVGSIFGLPGRATGGPVAPGRGYLIGERGPELFVPASAGRVEPIASQVSSDGSAASQIESTPSHVRPIPAFDERFERMAGRVPSNTSAAGNARDVRVSISVVAPLGSSVPQSLQRSTRQVASAVRRALATN